MKLSEVTGYLLCGMILAAGILFFVGIDALAEDVAITTYYPAPYGVYKEMRAKRMAIGDTYYDSSQYYWEDTSPNIGSEADLIVEGNVGIGTTSPNDKLHVAGHVNADAGYSYRFRNRSDLGLYEDGSYGLHISAPESIAINIDSNNNAGDIFFAIGRDAATANPTAGNTLFYINESGNVGIGTASPASSAKLHVLQTEGETIWFCGGQAERCHVFSNPEDCEEQDGCDWEYTFESCEGTPTDCSFFDFIEECEAQAGCSWESYYDSTAAVFMGGKVGIGTESPDYTLHVIGSCGGSATCNQDIAEVFSKVADESLDPGDVVVLSGTDKLNLHKSQKPYDTRVAGVYSTDPGMLIRGQEGIALSMGPQRESEFSDTQLPVSLAGKTLVKVTDENGPIKKGDLLTTSSTPGYAMRCPVETNEQKLRCMGAILGKALEPCDEPTSKILTLISLQ